MAESFPKAFGRYQLLTKLAQGGMAEIFLAEDERGHICAIKRILPHLAHEESFIRMFIDEARIVSQLDHPNITAVYDQGKESGFYYIAMEFVQGHSLLALSERAKATKMELPLGLLAFVVAELLAGLGCAHSARDSKGRHLGIVHRDVTPQNILISYDGEVKLLDFGVAKARSRLTQTEAGFTKGKLAYMSPEQARGEELDGRSDLFSVGIILHEITTNQRLFNKEGPGGILGAIVNDAIPRPSARVRKYPSALERVVMQALEKDIEQRYQTAEEMRDELLIFSQKERPTPSRGRLSALVHDLFGEPTNQELIKHVREHSAVISEAEAPVSSSGRLELGNVEPQEFLYPEESVSNTQPKRAEETRMMRADRLSSLSIASKAGIPLTYSRKAIASAVLGEPEPPVPEPNIPLRVKIGRFVRNLAAEFRLSWRQYPYYWRVGLGSIAVLVVVLLMSMTGVVNTTVQWANSAAEAAQAAKTQVGLVATPHPPSKKPRETHLRLTSEPPGAVIIVNGTGQGEVTPYTIENVETNKELQIELRLAGYRATTEKIRMRPNEGTREENFVLSRSQGVVEIESRPPGAAIYLDGKLQSKTTPARLENLAAGRTFRIELRAPGRKPRSQAVIVSDGEVRRVQMTLPIERRQIARGFIQISSRPSGCPVYLDKKQIGLTPTSPYKAAPGLHTVRLACEYHADEIRNVTVVSRDTTKLNLTARPTTFGYLTIEPIPAVDSRVLINNQRVKTPVNFLKLVPGHYRVTVENPRIHAKRQLSITIGPEARVIRRVTLSH